MGSEEGLASPCHQMGTDRRQHCDPDIGLCCCEYLNADGERSHILALCCDCEAVDKAADRLFAGQGLSDSSVGEIITVIEDRLRLPFKGGALKLPLGKVLPVLLLPSLIYISSLHPLLLLFSSLLLPLLFFIALRLLFKHRPQSQFFLFWSYSSAGAVSSTCMKLNWLVSFGICPR